MRWATSSPSCHALSLLDCLPALWQNKSINKSEHVTVFRAEVVSHCTTLLIIINSWQYKARPSEMGVIKARELQSQC
jgi:hypothetical protein